MEKILHGANRYVYVLPRDMKHEWHENLLVMVEMRGTEVIVLALHRHSQHQMQNDRGLKVLRELR